MKDDKMTQEYRDALALLDEICGAIDIGRNDVTKELAIVFCGYHPKIRQALQAQIDGGWLPIDTAPLDGIFIAIFDGVVSTCENCTDDTDTQRWFSSNEYGAYPIDELKYWQPLPTPPKES